MPEPIAPIAGLRVLIVEDEALIAEEIGDRLTKAGCEVVAIADNGNAAVSSAVELRPDLILMDVHLKGRMDGIEATDRIHERLQVPVVYLTAHSDHGTLQRAKASSAFGYVLKPFHVRNLLAAVEVAMDRFELERRLEDSQLTHATILQAIGEAVLATDTAGCVRFMNPEAERLTGWALKEAQGCAGGMVLKLAGTGQGEPLDDAFARVLAMRLPLALGDSALLTSRDGRQVPVEGRFSPVVDALGRLVGAVVYLRDVGEARSSREALLTMADRLRAVVDTAEDGVMMLDESGHILSFNPACERLFGHEASEVLGKSVEMMLPFPLIDELGRPLTRSQDARRPPARIKGRSTVGQCRNGMSFPCELSIGEASYGGRAVFVCVVHDISERRELEAELLNGISREQRRLGGDLHDGLGQDLIGLSLLMAAITRTAREKQYEHVDDMQCVEEMIQHTIRSCRGIAHGLSPVAETQGGLVAGLRELVARVNSAKGPHVDFEFTEISRLGLSANASEQLYRIAQEAVSNALKHAQAKTIKIRLDVDSGCVRLEVCDDGTGLHHGAAPASGLGLRTMRYRAAMLGARLEIMQSAPLGTCVICDCPRAA